MARIIISILLLFIGFQSHSQIAMFHAHNQQDDYDYVLDDYPGAIAAFSFWKLSSTYTGACGRVTNLTTLDEQDFGFVNNYIDTAAIKAFLTTVNGEIVFYDQSGTGNHTTRVGAVGTAFRFYSTGEPLRDANGLWKCRYNTGEWLSMPTGFLNAATTLSYFQVALIDRFASSNAGVFGPSTTGGVGLELLQVDLLNQPAFLRINGTRRNDNTGTAYWLWNDSTTSLTTILGNSGSVAAYKNSAAVTLTNSSAMPALSFNGVYALGRYNLTAYAKGFFKELIIYTTDQTSSRTGIETNINNRYSIY